RPEWFHMDGGFLLRISRNEVDFFITAGASIDPLHIDGRVIGLLIARGPPETDGGPAAGLAAFFSIDISVGTAPSSPGDARSALSDISNIFVFRGRVQVMLNTTRQEVDFTVPDEFLSVLPHDFP